MNWKYNTSSLSSYYKEIMAVINWKCAPHCSKHTGVCKHFLGSNALQYAMNFMFMYNYYIVIICILYNIIIIVILHILIIYGAYWSYG